MLFLMTINKAKLIRLICLIAKPVHVIIEELLPLRLLEVEALPPRVLLQDLLRLFPADNE